MNFVDKFLAKFGYVKATSPFPLPKDDRLLEVPQSDNSVTTYGNPQVSPQPQQLAGNPNSAQSGPTVNLEGAENTTNVATPFNMPQQENTNVPPTQPNTVQPKKIMDLEDVHNVNPLVAESMRKEGILMVDAEKFMERYNAMWAYIAKHKMSISEYLDGKR